MTNLNLVVAKMVEKKDLESRYGWASCFDYPEQYDKMTDLELEIAEICNDKLYDILDSVAVDVYNGNIDLETLEISHYSREEYLETYVLGDMDEQAKSMFESLYYFMNTDLRGQWLEANYLAHDPNIYTDKFMENIIMLHH